MKQAIVTPILKKSSLKKDEFKNYRPVSNLPFFSKVLERVAANQLHQHFAAHDLYPRNQSAYRPNHSVETALLRVSDSILRSLDTRKGVIMVLLDLSAAFDTLDYSILTQTLHDQFGIQGKALQWIQSYLTARSFKVGINSNHSKAKDLRSGVPQGSVLGPFLFTAYTAPMADLIDSWGVNFHLYADDTQLWCEVNLDDEAEMNRALLNLQDCVNDIHKWMTSNKLKLNSDKTELLLFHSNSRKKPIPDISISINGTIINKGLSARNLGVIFDSTLSFKDHISSICKNSFYHLRNIHKIKKYLPPSSLATLVHAFISSRIDFCNSLLIGLPAYQLNRLQKIQNHAARLISSSNRFDHITPILYKLHWLPLQFRIYFKLILFAHRSVYRSGPDYLSLALSTNARFTRQSVAPILLIPKSSLKTIGDRSFSVSASKLWNELPPNLRLISSFNSFKSNLKTYLFKQAFDI